MEISAGRTRDRIITFLNKTENKHPSQNLRRPFQMQEVSLFLRPGVHGGIGIDEVVVRFRTIPKFTNASGFEIGDQYILAAKPCLAPRSEFTELVSEPVADYPPGVLTEIEKMMFFSPNTGSMSLEFCFGHTYANSSHVIDCVIIQSMACKRQLLTGIFIFTFVSTMLEFQVPLHTLGEKPLYIPPFVVKAQNEGMPIKVTYHYAKFDDGLTIPDHLIHKVSFQSCHYDKEWQPRKTIYVGANE